MPGPITQLGLIQVSGPAKDPRQRREKTNMRTLLFMVGGIFLFVIFATVARALFRNANGHMRIAFALFALTWLAVSAYNMWVGVQHAGYSFAEELPIFLAIFGIPAVFGAVASRRLGRVTRPGA